MKLFFGHTHCEGLIHGNLDKQVIKIENNMVDFFKAIINCRKTYPRDHQNQTTPSILKIRGYPNPSYRARL